MWIFAATWAMALNGSRKAADILEHGGSGADALEALIEDAEDDPCFTSVGFGGLPDEDGKVTLDAAFMDGTSLRTGAVMGLEGYAHPFRIARSLGALEVNTVRHGEGAARYAEEKGFEKKDMRTASSLKKWKDAKGTQTDHAYRGHDTVGAVVLDPFGNCYAGTSTSGLFLKKAGRVGDSPLIGSGFYADSEAGAAAATGLGEDLMKGCVSYETVRLMREGCTAQEACRRAVTHLAGRLAKGKGKAGDLSVVAVSAKGDWGAYSNLASFTAVSASSDEEVKVFLVTEEGPEEASEELVREYMARHGKKDY